jgi:hypothetical protein
VNDPKTAGKCIILVSHIEFGKNIAEHRGTSSKHSRVLSLNWGE